MNEITQIQMDFTNLLLITSGWDSAIKIQKFNIKTHEVIKEVNECFADKMNAKGRAVQLVEVSVYHNILLIGA